MEEKPNYYAIIPAEVRYDTELKDKAKLLYGEITALSNKDGICYATNNYFANLYNVSATTISLLIKNLIDKGYLESEIIYKKGTKEIEYRYLKILKGGYLRNLKEGIKENLKENNTSINNNINNIYRHFENIFVRTLNSIEAQMIENWLKDKTEEQIINAINECAKSNIDNLKYIEKVLYGKKKNKNNTPEWFNKEIKSSEIEDNTEFNNFLEDSRNAK
jgi:DnaD/phage-associated family protein